MEPIEINAGAWYLRALRADERVDDRPALLAMAQDPATGLARDGVDRKSTRLNSSHPV